MDEPERSEWQIRCAFNGFCKRTLKNESINAHKELKKRQSHEINFSDLTPQPQSERKCPLGYQSVAGNGEGCMRSIQG